MAKVQAMQPKNKPVFNPSESYKWQEEDIFEITGIQLAALYHCIVREFNDAVGAPASMKAEAFSAITDVLRRGVEQGVIVPMETFREAESAEEIEQSTTNLFQK